MCQGNCVCVEVVVAHLWYYPNTGVMPLDTAVGIVSKFYCLPFVTCLPLRKGGGGINGLAVLYVCPSQLLIQLANFHEI